MNENTKDHFYIEIEETISLGLLAAYGKIYSGKYLKREEGLWVHSEDEDIKVLYEKEEKHYALLDERNNAKIDISEAAQNKEPYEVKWGKCGASTESGKDSIEYRRWIDRSEEFSFLTFFGI